MTASLFPVPPKLTDRQQAAYDYLQGDGATAEDVGRHLHLTVKEPPCRYCAEGPCMWARGSGQEALTALRRKGLVVRRRSGLWQKTGDRSNGGLGGFSGKTVANAAGMDAHGFPLDF